MVRAPAIYYLQGWTIHFDEGAEVMFPQHMQHEVRPKGEQALRWTTTLRIWVATEDIRAKVPQQMTHSEAQLNREINHAGSWKFWKLSEKDWVAVQQRKELQPQKDDLRLARRELQREVVREGRTIWQCGPKFNYATSQVGGRQEPSDILLKSTKSICKELPMRLVNWAQSI